MSARSPRRRRITRAVLAAVLLLGLGVSTSVGVAWVAASRAKPVGTSGSYTIIGMWLQEDPPAAFLAADIQHDMGYDQMEFAKGEEPRDVQSVRGQPAVPLRVRRWAERFDLHNRTANVVVSGWPARCLWMARISRPGPGIDTVGVVRLGRFDLPYQLERPGLATDTAFYASAWWLLLFAPRTLRRALRRRRGLCPACRYDLRGLPTGAPCPECGRASGEPASPVGPG